MSLNRIEGDWMYIAHKRDDGQEQPLLEHLIGTAEKASLYAKPFGKCKTAYLCGLFHDIGKYSKEFQSRIKNNGKLCDHSTAGAKELVSVNKRIGTLLGYVIAGHHSGLLNGGSWASMPEDGSLQGRLKKEVPVYNAYNTEISNDMIPLIKDIASEIACTKSLDECDQGNCFSFLVRMIYSCLVDADYIDTEEFINDKKVIRGVSCDFSDLEDKIIKHVNGVNLTREINKKRREIFEQCLKKAAGTPGVYKLSVPTGGGKTLSSMAFALRHIKFNPKLRRIIYVIPFMSIIEQNAKVFSDILGKEYILEHHSNYDFEHSDEETYNIKKLSAENWDVPIVVTTNVQFFESIYSNKSSKLRKLHNISNSVIILDEVQMLPTEHLIPCIKALEELVNNYNCTVVLCSATQSEAERFMSSKIKPIEICSNITELYNFFNKTRIKFIGRKTSSDLIHLVKGENQCLLVVNTKRQARKLYEKIKEELGEEGVFHLSTYMCPLNRLEKIEVIKDRLDNKSKCIVVSTSLIEAGVDIDFPVVYRAMCGLDSIIQAAGRCNRERKLDIAYLFVFDFEDEDFKVNKSSRFGDYLSKRQNITEIIKDRFDDVTRPDAIKEYFNYLFSNVSKSELDEKNILERLNNGFYKYSSDYFNFDFENIANDFRIIDDNSYSVIVKYNEDAKKIINEIEYGYLTKEKLRSLQKYTVTLHIYEFNKLKEVNAIKIIGEKIGILVSPEDYSKETGIKIPEQLGEAEFL